MKKQAVPMKRSFLSLFFVCITWSAFGQIRGDKGDFFIDFGPKVLFGENMMYNSKASFNSDRYFHNPGSLGYGAGFKLGLNFNRHIAIVGEGVYYRFNQVYDMSEKPAGGGRTINYQKNISYSALEIPIMFRYNNDEMDYVEFGYVHSMIMGVSEKNEGKGPAVGSDVQDLYISENQGAVFGFGGYVFGHNNFGISTGLRLRYDLNDFVKDGGSIDGASTYALDSEPSGSTNPLSLNLVVEFNYDLGFAMANSGCGNRKLLFSN